MGKQSKELKVLELFLNEPSKHWHFNEVVKKAEISEAKASKWLRKFHEEMLIKHVKPRRKMPYFMANFENPNYMNRKKIFALTLMHETGLLSYLQTLKQAKAVVIFGSFVRSDWHKDSDIDVFIYGNPENFKHGGIWKGLHRFINVYACKNKKETREISQEFMNNVIRGYFVKGSVQDIVKVSAWQPE